MLLLIILFLVAVIGWAASSRRNKETVAVLEDELEEVTGELRRIKDGNKKGSNEHKKALIHREHEIVRTLKLKYPKTTRRKYDNYRYEYDDISESDE